eukprot:1750684-Pyramimonas_sp.AAC.1
MGHDLRPQTQGHQPTAEIEQSPSHRASPELRNPRDYITSRNPLCVCHARSALSCGAVWRSEDCVCLALALCCTLPASYASR